MFRVKKGPIAGPSGSRSALSQGTEEPIRVGGQAVIEGVMMRSSRSMAVAVRKPNGEIVVKGEGLRFFSETTRIGKLPLVRGILALLSALVLGMRALNFSANLALDEGEKEMNSWAMGVTFSVALGLGIFLFFLVPLFLTRSLRFVLPALGESGLLFNLVDGLLRLVIFLTYLRVISLWKEIRRIFEYHGAEHKSIFALEAGAELTPERVREFSHLHPRCGTSFLLVVMVVSIVIFALLPHQMAFGYKVASRVVLIPFIAGLSYEIVRFADKRREERKVGYLVRPGLWLQQMTAREPSLAQIEVAIRALQEVLSLEGRNQEGVHVAGPGGG